MKNSGWVVYLFTDSTKSDIFKIMEFKTVRDIGYVFNVSPQVVSNYFHGLIRPRGILKNLVLYQSVNVFV